MATTTPNYGWPVPTSTDYVKDGAAAIEALGDAIDATVFALPAGLTLIKTQTIGTAVTSVNVTSAFSSTYDNYKITVAGGTASTGVAMGLQLGATTTGYYANVITGAYTANTVSGTATNNGSKFAYAGYVSTNGINLNVELIAPNLAKNTAYSSRYVEIGTSANAGTDNGFLNNTTQYTDFTLIPGGAATITGGTIRVYGFKNS
jgi:ribosomal protein S6E (S10)